MPGGVWEEGHQWDTKTSGVGAHRGGNAVVTNLGCKYRFHPPLPLSSRERMQECSQRKVRRVHAQKPGRGVGAWSGNVRGGMNRTGRLAHRSIRSVGRPGLGHETNPFSKLVNNQMFVHQRKRVKTILSTNSFCYIIVR